MRSKGLIATLMPMLACGALLVAGCSSSGTQSGNSSGGSHAILQLSGEGEVTIYTKNFNPFSPTADLGTTTAIFEPLVVYTPTNGIFHPWLATSWTFGPNATSLTFNLRHGVEWSDGKPFTSADVVYTFYILKKYFAGGGFPYVQTVAANGPDAVTFTFSKSYSPALGEVGEQAIAPKHIWDTVPNPVNYTNPTPVGTGPFNSDHRVHATGLRAREEPALLAARQAVFRRYRYPAYSPQSENDAIVQGTVDWGDGYIPNVQKTYADKNPNFHYFFAKTGGIIPLVFNMKVSPLNNVVVRKAISMAINREANVSSVYGSYTAVGNSTGVSPTFTFYDPAIQAANDWTTQNIAKANQMLDAAGFKRGPNGIRVSPSGQQLSFTLETGLTSADYVQSSQNVAADVAKIGIKLTVTPKAWNTVISDVELGSFQIAHMFEQVATTPYTFFNFYMSCNNIVPIGKVALQTGAATATRRRASCSPSSRRPATLPSRSRSPPTSRPSSRPRRRSCRCSSSRTGASSTRPGSPAFRARATRMPRARHVTRAP